LASRPRGKKSTIKQTRERQKNGAKGRKSQNTSADCSGDMVTGAVERVAVEILGVGKIRRTTNNKNKKWKMEGKDDKLRSQSLKKKKRGLWV